MPSLLQARRRTRRRRIFYYCLQLHYAFSLRDRETRIHLHCLSAHRPNIVFLSTRHWHSISHDFSQPHTQTHSLWQHYFCQTKSNNKNVSTGDDDEKIPLFCRGLSSCQCTGGWEELLSCNDEKEILLPDLAFSLSLSLSLSPLCSVYCMAKAFTFFNFPSNALEKEEKSIFWGPDPHAQKV